MTVVIISSFLASFRWSRRCLRQPCRAKLIARAMADLHQRFLKIDPGQPAQQDGNDQGEERNPDVMPGVEPRNPCKKQAQEEFVEQVSAVGDDDKAAQPVPAQAAADPTVAVEQSVKQES